MSKNITEVENVLHIISEPGDATRYDYIVIPGEEEYRFYPYGNDFNYPTIISVHQTEEDKMFLASKYKCNPHTVAECIRTMQELRIGSDNQLEYIKVPKEKYANLLCSAYELQLLECGGVDNWAHYSDSLNPEYEMDTLDEYTENTHKELGLPYDG